MYIPKIPLNPTRNAAKLGRIFGISIKNEKKFQKKKHVGKKIAPRCAELLSIYSLIRVFTWRILASTHSQLLC